jgi:hypothetical protein
MSFICLKEFHLIPHFHLSSLENRLDFRIFFIINMDVWTSLYISRQISWILKLTTM